MKLDLSKHLPPRLSDVSRSDDDAQADRSRRDGSNGESPCIHASLSPAHPSRVQPCIVGALHATKATWTAL